MRIVIYCFSGTGHTKMVCDRYAAAFEENGHEVTVRTLPLEQNATGDSDDFDIIGIGYPIHAFNAPKIVLDLCKSLPKRDKKDVRKRAFVFKSSGEPVRMSDISSLKMCKILKRRGYDVTNEYQYVMPYNIIFRHSDAAAYKMWQTTKALVPVDVAEITDGTTALPKKLFMGGFLAWILRAEHWGAHILGKFFATTESCTKCGLCIKNCPANNIKQNKKGKLKFGGKCMICMRCSFNCPKNAVKLGMLKGWKVNGAYSFDPPDPESPQEDMHEDYCKKAYDRYYENAQNKIVGNKHAD